MCLGVPGQVIEWIEKGTVFARARISFGGITRECQMACVPDAQVGDFVVVHAGIAISLVAPEEAQQALAEWTSMSPPDEGGPTA